MSTYTFDQLSPEYELLWNGMIIKPTKSADVDTVARKILAKKTRYQAVEHECRVPWYLVGTIHSLECGLRFDRHLHCGDPLTARTIHVPKGRPVAKPKNGSVYTWEESAIDALTTPPHALQKVPEWSIERICYEAERWNGFGFRMRGVPSAYLWSCSQHYTKGRYVADGQWSSMAVSAQCGAMPIIKRLAELDPEVAAAIGTGQHDDEHPETITEQVERAPDPALEFPKAYGPDIPVSDVVPPAAPATPAALAHAGMHQELKVTSWLYSVHSGLLKLLGVGTASGTGGIIAAAQSDPVGTTSVVVSFFKEYGWQLAAAALVAIVVLEVFRFAMRQHALKQKEATT